MKINQQITNKQIRLKETGELISRYEALNRAKNSQVDLIELATYGEPEVSVCILQSYDKYCYQQKKREKQLKANQVKVVNKEIRFGPQTDEHDYNFKLKHIKNFIKQKARVKACVVFQGREIAFKEQGEVLLLRLASDLEDIAKIESMLKLEGKKICLTLIPK